MTARQPAAPRLRCLRCGAESPLGRAVDGCLACAKGDDRASLEVVYDYDAWRAKGTLERWRSLRPSVWSYHELLPLASGTAPVSLEEGGTPLIRLDLPGPGRLWVKDESRNPTGAFKDRGHSVSVSMAKALGYRKVTASTTGNHGTSLAAYATKAGLDCLIFVDPRGPELQRRLMQLYGARVAVLPDRRSQLAWLVRERGWYPSTGLTPMPVCTPYGIEGYKSIGYEVYFQLGERMPAWFLAPVAVGDIVYGPWKAFKELERLGVEAALPKMVSVQPTGCDPIVQAWRERAPKVPVHPDPRTIALSIGDETAGVHALTPLYESNGRAEAVSDEAMLAAMRMLARQGIVVEPSSAASVAAALVMQERGLFTAEEDVVCLCTGAGAKWPEAVHMAAPTHELRDQDPEAFRGWVRAFDHSG